MKILHVSDWVNGGLATYLETLCHAQSQQHDVMVLASQRGSEARIVSCEGFVSLDPYSRSLRGIWHAFSTTRRTLRRYRPDILHVHSSFAGLFARLATIGLKHQPRVIYCAHGWSFLMQGSPIKARLYGWIERLLSYRCDAIITISSKEHHAAIAVGIEESKLHLIEHGIAAECEPLRPYQLEEHFTEDRFNILFLGRYDYAKGFDWLMDFIARYPYQHIRWHCAGRAVVDDVVTIPSDIVDHGWVAYNDVSQLLLRCDAVIIPSRWEGFGLSAIEAMKYAKPVIAARNGALPELITHEKNGWLFTLEDEQSLCVILEQLTRQRIQAYGKVGYNIFMNRYTQEKMLHHVEVLLSTLSYSHKEQS